MAESESRAALSSDTSAAVEGLQIERWRAMSVREKATLVTQLSQTADAMALAGIRAADPLRVAAHVTSVLSQLGVLYSIGGSLASSVSGEPRSTLDIDIVAALEETHVDALTEMLRQWRDVLGVIHVQGQRLDREYLTRQPTVSV